MRYSSNQRPIVLCDPDIKPIPRSANDLDRLGDRPSVANQSHDERELLARDAPREMLRNCRIAHLHDCGVMELRSSVTKHFKQKAIAASALRTASRSLSRTLTLFKHPAR